MGETLSLEQCPSSPMEGLCRVNQEVDLSSSSMEVLEAAFVGLLSSCRSCGCVDGKV
jgi:hypothetical protein